MGYRTTEWAYTITLPRAEKAVLVYLAARADDEKGTCFPGQANIANNTGFSDRTVRRALKTLETNGVIRRVRRFDGNGYRNSDLYVLDLTMTTDRLPDMVTSGHGDQWPKPARLPDKTDAPTGHGVQVIVSTSSSYSASPASKKINDGDTTIADALNDALPEMPIGNHDNEGNARRALDTLRRERSLPMHVKELVRIAYKLGNGDPWAGYLQIKQRTDADIRGARDPEAVLRARLSKAA
jgi:DNA-binding transcriptional ArsR family regulator